MLKRLQGVSRAFSEFVLLLFRSRQLIWEMAWRDVVQKYVGSRVGLLWTVIHPLSLIFIFWFVFGYGLKAQPVDDVPFSIWLTAGMAAWFAFSEIVAESTGVIVNNPHLIKKIRFPSQILPVVKIVSSLINHLIFIALLFLLLFFHHMSVTFLALQVFYYYFCLIILALGLSWMTSALNVFVRDVGQVIQLFLQITFWATPIIWTMDIMPPKIQTILRLNPMCYVVQGYREAFIYHHPFWSDPAYGLYFWLVSLSLLIVGALVFRRLKPHFPDVL